MKKPTLFLCSTANASIVSFGLDTEFSGAAQPAGPMPRLTSSFNDGAPPGSVTLTLSFSELLTTPYRNTNRRLRDA